LALANGVAEAEVDGKVVVEVTENFSMFSLFESCCGAGKAVI
jgi:hypothetical protein